MNVQRKRMRSSVTQSNHTSNVTNFVRSVPRRLISTTVQAKSSMTTETRY